MGYPSYPFSLSISIFLFFMSIVFLLLQVHKLLKLQIKPGQESELCHMIIDCCAQQRTYEKFFGLMGQRFCQVYEAQFSNRCTLYVAELQNCAVPQTHKCTLHIASAKTLPTTGDQNLCRTLPEYFRRYLQHSAQVNNTC